MGLRLPETIGICNHHIMLVVAHNHPYWPHFWEGNLIHSNMERHTCTVLAITTSPVKMKLDTYATHMMETKDYFLHLWVMNLANDITVFLVILISSGISIISFKKAVQEMNDLEEMKRDELKRFRFNFIARLKQRKLGAMIFCICLCYVMLRLPLTIIGNEGIPQWKFAFASCLFPYNLLDKL